MSVMSQLKAIQYTSAQEHYKNLKEEFLQQYSMVSQRTEDELIEEFLNQFKDLSDVSRQEEVMKAVMEELSQVIHERLSKNNKNAIYGAQQNQTAYQTFQNLKKDTKTISKEIQEFSQQLISAEELKDLLLKHVPTKRDSGVDYTDLLNNMRGAVNKILKQQTLRKISLKHFVKSAKGYLHEAVIHEMLKDFNAKLTNQFWANTSTLHAGAKKGKNNLDTPYDHWIDLFNQAERSFTAHAQEDLNIGYGFQTKSWIAPWDKTNSYIKNFHIGSRKGVYNEIMGKTNNASLQEKHRWLVGLRLLEQKFKEVIGERQVGYFTGNKFYWTHELIRKFRSNDYFYNFVYNKDKNGKAVATSSIAWQQHDPNWYQNH